MLVLERLSVEGNSYPMKIKTEVIFKRISYIKVLDALKKDIDTNPGAYRYQVVDRSGDFFEVFSPTGELLDRSDSLTIDQVFLGNDNPKFSLGQIVEVVDINQLRLGVITGLPVTTDEVKKRKWKLDYSDNVYLVDFSEDTNEHIHPFEFMLRSPSFYVSPEEQLRLKQAFDTIQANQVVQLAKK